MHLRTILLKFNDLLYPPRCLGCKEYVVNHGSFCNSCWDRLSFLSEPFCQKCAYPFEFVVEGVSICTRCLTEEPIYDIARSPFIYDDLVRRLIHGFKYHDALTGAKYFAKFMVKSAEELISESDIITFVPLNRFRLFKRKYNQAGLLAYHIAKQTAKPIYYDLLVRNKKTKPQFGLSYAARKLNVRGAFALNRKYISSIAGKNILLVDDVLTTGATLNACASVLKESKATSVKVLTLARAKVNKRK